MNEQEMSGKISAIEQKVSDDSRRMDRLEQALDELVKEQKTLFKLTTAVEVIATRISSIEEKVEDTNKKVNEQAKIIRDVENAPYKRTHDNVSSIKLAVITGICSMIASGVVAGLISFLVK